MIKTWGRLAKIGLHWLAIHHNHPNCVPSRTKGALNHALEELGSFNKPVIEAKPTKNYKKKKKSEGIGR